MVVPQAPHRPQSLARERPRSNPFAEVNTAIADSLSGATIKPVLTFD
jgi:hypothetical protein